MTHKLKCYTVIYYCYYRLQFFCHIICALCVNEMFTLLIHQGIWYIFLILNVSIKIHFILKILWDVKISNYQYSKTTGPILMKFTGFHKQVHRGLYTNFQSNLKFYTKVRIFNFKGYRCLPWSYMYTEKIKELSNLLIFHENDLILS